MSSEKEIEVTPEMVEAGVAALNASLFNGQIESPDQTVVVDVFRSMLKASYEEHRLA